MEVPEENPIAQFPSHFVCKNLSCWTGARGYHDFSRAGFARARRQKWRGHALAIFPGLIVICCKLPEHSDLIMATGFVKYKGAVSGPGLGLSFPVELDEVPGYDPTIRQSQTDFRATIVRKPASGGS
jgi:hypothetical protein